MERDERLREMEDARARAEMELQHASLPIDSIEFSTPSNDYLWRVYVPGQGYVAMSWAEWMRQPWLQTEK